MKKTAKILAIGTSSNRTSINLTLAAAAASQIEGAEVEQLSVADYELPLFSDDREAELGTPALAREFLEKIAAADAIVVSFAEYNGTYTASFKNIFDWASRIEKEVFQNKPAVFMSTSPGPGGASSVLSQALGSARFWGARVVGSLSVPRFAENYSHQRGELADSELRRKLDVIMRKLFVEMTGQESNESDSHNNSTLAPLAREVCYDSIA